MNNISHASLATLFACRLAKGKELRIDDSSLVSMRSEVEQKFVNLVSDKDFFPAQVANMLDLSKVRLCNKTGNL